MNRSSGGYDDISRPSPGGSEVAPASQWQRMGKDLERAVEALANQQVSARHEEELRRQELEQSRPMALAIDELVSQFYAAILPYGKLLRQRYYDSGRWTWSGHIATGRVNLFAHHGATPTFFWRFEVTGSSIPAKVLEMYLYPPGSVHEWIFHGDSSDRYANDAVFAHTCKGVLLAKISAEGTPDYAGFAHRCMTALLIDAGIPLPS